MSIGGNNFFGGGGGGRGFSPFSANRPTRQYLKFHQLADRNGDGKLSRQELQGYNQRLENNFLRSLLQYVFQGGRNPELGDQLRSMKRQMDIGRDMENGFDRLAGKNGGGNHIRRKDIRRAAERDREDPSFLNRLDQIFQDRDPFESNRFGNRGGREVDLHLRIRDVGSLYKP